MSANCPEVVQNPGICVPESISENARVSSGSLKHTVPRSNSPRSLRFERCLRATQGTDNPLGSEPSSCREVPFTLLFHNRTIFICLTFLDVRNAHRTEARRPARANMLNVQASDDRAFQLRLKLDTKGRANLARIRRLLAPRATANAPSNPSRDLGNRKARSSKGPAISSWPASAVCKPLMTN
jgi:hypothetical protein